MWVSYLLQTNKVIQVPICTLHKTVPDSGEHKTYTVSIVSLHYKTISKIEPVRAKITFILYSSKTVIT